MSIPLKVLIAQSEESIAQSEQRIHELNVELKDLPFSEVMKFLGYDPKKYNVATDSGTPLEMELSMEQMNMWHAPEFVGGKPITIILVKV